MHQDSATAAGLDAARRAIRVDDLLIEPAQRRVSRKGSELPLPHLSYELLLVLVEQAPDLVTTEQLMERVWPRLVVGSETVVQRVKLLRQVLGDDSRKPRYIEGVRGRGYRLIAAVTRPVAEAGGGMEPVTAEPARTDPVRFSPTRQMRRRLFGLASTVGAVLLLAAAMVVLPWRDDLQSPAANNAPPRLAILPVENLSPGRDMGWLAAGIGDELGALLARVEDLLVIHPYSSERLQGQDPEAIQNALRADYLLTGSLRANDTTFRLTLTLTRTADSEQLWAETYTSPFDDILLVQEEIATAVSTALQVTLATGIFGRTPGMTRNADAYAEYLKAITLSTQEIIQNPRRLLQHLERALVLDPEFTLASINIYSYYNSSIPYLAPPDAFPERETRMAEALDHWRQIDPDDPLLLLIEGMDAAASSRWLEAERGLEAFLEAARHRYGTARQSIVYNIAGIQGQFLRDTGRMRESIPLLERALSMDPLNPGLHAFLSESWAGSGEIERGLELNTTALALPGLQNDALLYGNRLLLLMGMTEPGQLDASAVNNLLPGDDGYNISRSMLGLQHDRAQALEELRTLTQASNLPAQQVNTSAAWAAWHGDTDLALELLDRVRQMSPYSLGAFLARPVYAGVRKAPGFKQIVRDLGLVDYWRASGNWGDYCRPLTGSEQDFECF